MKKINIGLCLIFTGLLSACNDNVGTGSFQSGALQSALTSSSSSSAYNGGINAVQIITKSGSTGSFDATSVPASGGVAAIAQRFFALDGSQISSGNMPTWISEAKLFLTSSRTSAGSPTYINGDTPCAYFDGYSGDSNPDSDSYYTIDGYNTSIFASDVDQCAGTGASELNKLGLYIKLDRRFMNATDKIQIIVKAKPIDAPNTTPTASSCVTGGYFDASNCSNQVYTLTMRTAPYASAQPFYLLFPSAKAYDLLSESIILPIQVDSNITTISMDRVKGGAIIYGITVIRLL